MSRLVVVNVFREDTGKSASGIPVTIGGGYGECKTNHEGKAVFKLPDDLSWVSIYVKGSRAFDNYVSKIPSEGLDVIVSASGYYKKTL